MQMPYSVNQISQRPQKQRILPVRKTHQLGLEREQSLEAAGEGTTKGRASSLQCARGKRVTLSVNSMVDG